MVAVKGGPAVMYNRSFSQRTQVHQGSDRSTPHSMLAPVSAVLPMLKGTGASQSNNGGHVLGTSYGSGSVLSAFCTYYLF